MGRPAHRVFRGTDIITQLHQLPPGGPRQDGLYCRAFDASCGRSGPGRLAFLKGGCDGPGRALRRNAAISWTRPTPSTGASPRLLTDKLPSWLVRHGCVSFGGSGAQGVDHTLTPSHSSTRWACPRRRCAGQRPGTRRLEKQACGSGLAGHVRFMDAVPMGR